MQLSRRRLGQLSIAALASASACANAPEPEPDVLIYGGPIYTGVDANPRVEALRIRNGRIVFAGALEEARAGMSMARAINLAGSAAFPGFIDAHVHLPWVGVAAMQLDLVGVESIAALQQRLAAYAQSHPQGPIVGRGWIETHWPEQRFPNRADLDGIVGNRPVVLRRADGHSLVTNSAGLTLAGIDANTPNPDGGSIERNEAGEATGVLIDNAMALVQSRLPSPSSAEMRQALTQAAQLYAQRGWTGVCNMSTSGEEAALFEALAAEGAMPLWSNIYLTPEDAELVFARGPYADASGRVNVRGVKLYCDGSLGSRGAALLAPYSDAPGSNGLLLTPEAELRALLRRARERGVQVATHAIGDRGNRLTLDAYRDVFADDPDALRAARWRVEHAQILAQSDIPRFAQMGVIASMQASHAIGDLYFAPARLGSDRLAGAYAWQPLLSSGAVIAAGTDAPVEKGDPLIEFYAASYRHALDGFAGPDWHPENAVSRAAALRMLSWGGAYSAFAENERGTLTQGKRADISVFSEDLMQAEPSAILQAQTVLTMSGGRITYRGF